MNKELWDIANDDLALISISLEKIKATAISTYSYLDGIIDKPSEKTNNVLYMLDVIEDLSKIADNGLSGIIDKLSALSRTTK